MTDATVPAYGQAPVPWLVLLASQAAQGGAFRAIAGPGDDEEEEVDDEDLDDEEDDLDDEDVGDEDEDLDDTEDEEADEDE